MRDLTTSQVLGQDPHELFDVLPAPPLALVNGAAIVAGGAPPPSAGSAPRLRSDVHCEGLWHRSIHLWLVDRHGDVLLQQRSRHKDTWPLHWDVSCAGHVEAGEDIGVPAVSTALRELQEELGVRHAPDELEYLFTYAESSRGRTEAGAWQNNEYQDVFLLRLKAAHEDIAYATDASGQSEVAGLRWTSPERVRSALHNANPGDNRPSYIGGLFVPRSELYCDPLFQAMMQ